MSNNSIEILPLSKTRHWSEGLHPQANLLAIGRGNEIKRIILTLYLWLEESEDNIEITQFLYQYKIPQRTFSDLRSKHKDLNSVVTDIMVFLGARKKLGALTRKYDKDMVLKDLHKYLPEWDEINKYHSELKQTEAPKGGDTVYVLTDKAEHTGVVPKRKKKEANESGNVPA